MENQRDGLQMKMFFVKFHEDDRWVLESVLRANADILVTGDKDLLVLSNTVSGLEIISPRGIWNSLKK